MLRVLILGGTKFIGRAITGYFAARGDEVTVVHRGQAEPPDLADCQHIHVSRADFASVADQVAALRPDAVVDTLAMTRADVDAVLPHLPDTRLVVLSSADVYRAFELMHEHRSGQPVPITEESQVRLGRYPYRGQIPRMDDYDKLDVEPAWLARGGTVLRLGFIYGEHDGQRREEFILRRVRAGRTRIPVGAGNWLISHCYVGDVATAVAASVDSGAARGQIFNIVEPDSVTILDWAGQILAAAGHQAEFVTVPEAVLPEDMDMAGFQAQHLLFSSRKARDLLGWSPADPAASIAASVRWHLAHPPADADPDFSDDDQALAAAG